MQSKADYKWTIMNIKVKSILRVIMKEKKRSNSSSWKRKVIKRGYANRQIVDENQSVAMFHGILREFGVE